MVEKTKAYILCTKTFRDLEKIANSTTDYKAVLYKHEIDRSGLSKEQKEIQSRNHWYTQISNSFRIWDIKLDDMVKEEIMSKVLEGYKEDIANKVLENILDSEVRFIGKINKDNNNANRSDISLIEEIKEERNDNYDYRTDTKEFEELAKDLKTKTGYSPNSEEIYIEEICVDIYAYMFNDFTKKIKKSINKYIRNNLTYCLKKGKLIVPEEYINKGQEGIEEWRKIKSSNNKNNSIEKKLLKDTIKEKKKYAYDSVYRAMDKVTSAGNRYDWTVPRLVIDGKYNKQRTQKLVTKILGTKDRQEIIEMSEQEIVNRAKAYWKQQLMDAYNEVDKMEV